MHGGARIHPDDRQRAIQPRRSHAVPLPASPSLPSWESRSLFGSSASSTASLHAALVSPTRPTERIDDRPSSIPRSSQALVPNLKSSDAATVVAESPDAATGVVAQPLPVSPLPSTCKSVVAAIAIVPVPRLLSPDARFPILPLGRFPNLLSAVLHLPPVQTRLVAFRFVWSDDAARHNLAILRKFRLDLAAALAAQPFSTITPGSEFPPSPLLAPLLSHHQLWPRFREHITLGAEFPLTAIADADRRADLQAILSRRGNHKSVRGHEAKLTVMLKEECQEGGNYLCPRKQCWSSQVAKWHHLKWLHSGQ